MIINADSLLPHLREKVRPSQSDTSRHLLCPHCVIRTRLNTLGDGRRKCTTCGKKFRIHKVTANNKLQQCAEILLCFCLDFSAHRASQITHHRYRLIVDFYDDFRKLLAERNLPHEKILLLETHAGRSQGLDEQSRCRWCGSAIRSGAGRPPVFGVRLGSGGTVYINPLNDDEAMAHFPASGTREVTAESGEGYAGFICCGKFHGCAEEEKAKEAAEELWAWIRERAAVHHGIWKRNTGFYLKELEWKYNNRLLDPDMQGQKIIGLMSMDFLNGRVVKTED